MFYLNRPDDFKPAFEVANSFITHRGAFLLLLRQPYKSQPSKWGLPGGKVEPEESKELAAIRELQEETGIALRQEEMHFFRTAYVRYPNVDFTYHMFHYALDHKPEIVIDPEEHIESTWRTPKESLSLPLVDDLASYIRLFYDPTHF